VRAHFGFSETLAGTNGRSTIAEVMDCADGKRIHPGPVAEDPFVDSRIMTVTPRRWPPVGGLRRRGALNLSIMLIVSTLLSGSAAAASAARSGRTSDPVAGVAASGKPYPCAPGAGQSIYGTFGDASAIGWQGNAQGVVACLGGSFYVQDGLNTTYGYGIYNKARTTWANVDGYLPALISAFHRNGVDISITNFGDEVSLGGDAYVAVYSRVAIHNPTGHTARVDPEPSPGLIPLDSAPVDVEPRATVNHDYVIAVDRFGQAYPWPSSQALGAAGGFDAHFAHMRDFWNTRLASIAQLRLPDIQLTDAYRSGFVYTQIARSGDNLNTGVNGYESEYSHDVIGILTNLFTQGDFSNARALLLEARNAVGSRGQYEDGLWTYAWPWATYLLKTGDIDFVKANFSTEGPNGTSTPSIEDTAHLIAAQRTGPGGILHRTLDIDFRGYWTIDNYEALLGLAAYRYLAQSIGNSGEVVWATQQYDSLLAATNSTLQATIRRNHLHALPCSMLDPNSFNTCANPLDANWTSPLGRWAWDGSLFGATRNGPGISMIDATYAYGFHQLVGKLPANTFGGFPVDYYYSTGYNAGIGNAGLASNAYRDQGILGYEFMIRHSQSGPYSWWESVSAPNPASPWVGSHPRTGQGSSPHAWGMATANNVLLDSLVVQRSDGSVLIGRGVPDPWIRTGKTISVANFASSDGHRLGFAISVRNRAVSLTLTGDHPSGPVLFQLPAFVHNLRRSGSGTVDNPTGTVTLPSGATHITVELLHPV
jgi:hypothetical protein